MPDYIMHVLSNSAHHPSLKILNTYTFFEKTGYIDMYANLDVQNRNIFRTFHKTMLHRVLIT